MLGRLLRVAGRAFSFMVTERQAGHLLLLMIASSRPHALDRMGAVLTEAIIRSWDSLCQGGSAFDIPERCAALFPSQFRAAEIMYYY